MPVEQKLFRIVRLSDDGTEAARTLGLLSKESIGELQALWSEQFEDQRVQAALDGLFEPEPDAALVRLIRRRVPDLTPKQIRAAVQRIRSRGSSREPGQGASLQAPVKPGRQPRKKGSSHGEGTPWSKITLADLLAAGLLHPPVSLWRRYKGVELTGRIETDGRVTFGTETYGSLSVAAGMARKSVIGSPPGRVYPQTWTFWLYASADGERHTLDELRRDLWARRG